MGNSKTKVIAVTNQKGGVAKSTTTINVGAGLAIRGKNVLLVDMDGQGDLSGWLGYDGEQKPTVSDLIWSTVSPANHVTFEYTHCVQPMTQQLRNRKSMKA